jgi:hypothetical protein
MQMPTSDVTSKCAFHVVTTNTKLFAPNRPLRDRISY